MCIFIVFGVAQNTLSIEVGDGAIDVLYNSDADIGGFQFTVEGATVTGGSGGDSAANGFMISCSSSMCLGFSLTGNIIPAGSGTLVVVSADITGDVSLTGIVVSDAVGGALDFTYDDGGNGGGEITDGCELPDLNMYLATDGLVLYNSSEAIGGFQFNVDGATINGASGGDAGDAGFMISSSATTVLGFSLTGDTFGPGCGTMVVLDLTGEATGLSEIVISDPVGQAIPFEYYSDGDDPVPGCTDSSACNYDADATEDDGSCTYAEENYDCAGNCTAGEDCAGECGGDAVVDECGECGGDGTSCATSTIDILYNTTTDIGGFQFNVDGATVTGASGGAAADAGFTISTGNNTVLAFSFSGATIPAGSGVLVQVEVQGDASVACLSAVVLSDPIGVAISNEITDCFTISQVEIILGCMDDTACNYDADATEGDGSCEYAQENYDCDGNCTVEVDCTGECGGDAVVDECGVCNGDGIADGACDCAGNVEDCAGVCGGDSVVDECGECGGDGIDEGACDCDGSVEDCAGVCGGDSIVDECGECGGDGIADGACDCDGNVEDCAGECGGSAEVDECGECGGDGSSCTTTVDLSIDLIAGWNWISINVLPEDPSIGSVLADLGADALFINSQADGAATNYAEWGIWDGALSAFEPDNMYLLQMGAPATLVVTGTPVDVVETPIELIAGWNWLGYLPQNSGAVGEALESLGADALFINSQADGASTNYSEWGIWDGALATLESGKGYLLQMGAPATFTYPEFDGLSRLDENKQEVMLSQKISDWDFHYGDYEFIGTISASIENHEDFDGDVVGVFVDGECRGISERMYFQLDDTYYYMIQVYSNEIDGEALTFKYYDKTNDEVIEYSETLTFESNMIVGDGFNTFGLSRERNVSQLKAYSISDAYPNPFNPVTSFEYTIPEDGMVQIAVYDISGRMVAELVNGYMSASSYPVTWDAQELSSGVYMVNMTAGNYSTIQKVMLIK